MESKKSLHPIFKQAYAVTEHYRSIKFPHVTENKPLSLINITYKIYVMTPVAQQSTGLPYRCLPTTSGAAPEKKTFTKFLHVCKPEQALPHLHVVKFNILTQILWRPTGLFD